MPVLPRRSRHPVLLVVAVVAGLLAAFTLVKAVLKIASDDDLGTPEMSELLPLADGATVVAQRTFESEGSRGGGTRLLVVDTAGTGQPADAFPDDYLDALETRDWRRPTEPTAISNRTGACVTVDTLDDFPCRRSRAE